MGTMDCDPGKYTARRRLIVREPAGPESEPWSMDVVALVPLETSRSILADLLLDEGSRWKPGIGNHLPRSRASRAERARSASAVGSRDGSGVAETSTRGVGEAAEIGAAAEGLLEQAGSASRAARPSRMAEVRILE